MNCIIFGASTLGRLAMDTLEKKGAHITAFTDNGKSKWDTLFLGKPVIPPKNIPVSADTEVVIASTYHVSIARQLIDMGIKRFSVFYMKRYMEHELISVDYSDIDDFTEKNNKIAFIVDNYSGSNTAAFYRYCVNNGDSRFEYAIVEENSKTPDYYRDILTSKIIIRTYSGGTIDGKINIQLWHGIPLKGLGYMAIAGDHDREAQHKEWQKFDYIISYSQAYSTLMGACFGVSHDRFKVLGLPRNDTLFNSDGKKLLNKLYGIKPHEKAIIYMPTYRQSNFGEHHGSEDGYFFSAEDFNAQEFNSYLKANNIKMLVKLHQFSIEKLPESLKSKDNIIIADNMYFDESKLDFYELLNGFDLLITDYSSVYFDFLLLDRPIIFTPLDLERYMKLQGTLLEPYDFFAPGAKALTMKGVMKEIDKSFSDSEYYQKERLLIKSIAHKYTDESSCKRLYEFICEIIDKEEYRNENN